MEIKAAIVRMNLHISEQKINEPKVIVVDDRKDVNLSTVDGVEIIEYSVIKPYPLANIQPTILISDQPNYINGKKLPKSKKRKK